MDILIVDDHVLLRDGLALLLKPLDLALNVIGANTLDQALGACAEHDNLDLILLELAAPGVDGIAGLRALRQRAPATPLVALGHNRTREEVLAAIESGAQGYVPKSATGERLLGALKLVLAGETYVPSLVLNRQGGPRRPAANALDPGFVGPLARLTARQREVLMLIADGLGNARIAEVLGIELNTVKNHVKAIFKVLGAANRTQAVVEAVRLGLRPPGTAP